VESWPPENNTRAVVCIGAMVEHSALGAVRSHLRRHRLTMPKYLRSF
jgi:hypothetical protein